MSPKYFGFLILIFSSVSSSKTKTQAPIPRARKIAGRDFKTTQAITRRKRKTTRAPDKNVKTTIGYDQKFVPEDNFLTTPMAKTTGSNMITKFVPDSNFGPTTAMKGQTSTEPNAGTMFLPDGTFMTSPGTNVQQTTLPNTGTMFVPNNNFVTSPETNGQQTTLPNAGTMFVPNNNFVTYPGTNGQHTTLPNAGTMFVPNNNFVTSPETNGQQTTLPNVGTMFVPNNNFATTPETNGQQTTLRNVGTMFVPNNNFVTSPETNGQQTTLPNVGTMFVRNNNFVTSPETNGQQTTLLNSGTMFVPNNNFVTSPGTNGQQTTLLNSGTMFVPNNNFVTSPGTNGQQTTLLSSGTMFVPNNNFVTSPGTNGQQTTLLNSGTMFVPNNNFVTSPGTSGQQTTLPNAATMFVPNNNFATSPGTNGQHSTLPNSATMFVPEGNFLTTRGIEKAITAPVGLDEIETGTQNMVQTTQPSINTNTASTESSPIVHETVPQFIIQTTPQPEPIELIPEFQIPSNNFYLTPPVFIPVQQQANFALEPPPMLNYVTQKTEPMIAVDVIHTTPLVDRPELVTIPPIFEIATDDTTTQLVGIIAPGIFQTTTEPVQHKAGEFIPITQEVHSLTIPPELNSATHRPQYDPNIAQPVLQIYETTPHIAFQDMGIAGNVTPQPQSSGDALNGGTTQARRSNAARTQAPNIPIVNFGTTPQAAPDQPTTNPLFSVISDNSSTSENQPITSTQQALSSTLAPGLQHHQLGTLLETVLTDYYPQFRPRNDQNRFVAIFTDFVPISIIEFNTQEQKFSVMGYFKMDWRDDFLTWDPSSYEDTEILRIPVKSIWTPKLVIDKAYDGDGIVGDAETDIALINYRGYVRWFPEGIYSVVCKVTIQFYPFDKQTCVLTYFIADEDNSTINLKHFGEVDLAEYIENAEWKLTNLTVERKQTDNIYVVNYHFHVERRGGFALFTLVVPTLMLSVLSGTTFLVPIESGEKCSFSVSVFLAYGIFETIVIDTLPHNSLDVSYFIMYLTSLLIISVVLTFYTILQAKIFDSIGTRRFGTICKSSLTWGGLLQKLDNYAFATFILVVLGLTSIFFSVMEGKFEIL